MTMTDVPRRVSPSTAAIIETQVALAAAYPLDHTNHLLDSAVREIHVALMAEVGHSLNSEDVHDAVVHLVDVVQRLEDLQDNPGEYLNSLGLPSTDLQYDITRGELLADKVHWTQRLLDLR